jgi:hypothetical protein
LEENSKSHGQNKHLQVMINEYVAFEIMNKEKQKVFKDVY